MSARDRSLLHLDEDATAEGRRAQQFEIEKANIYASHLSTRSYLVEKYFTYLENSRQPKRQHYSPGVLASGFDNLLPQPTGEYDSMEQDMAQERENVIKDLLLVLGSIDLVNMEPNADSFVRSPFTFSLPILLPPLITSSRRKRSAKSPPHCWTCPKAARGPSRSSTKSISTSS
jgi:hypothetical protein